MNPIEDAVRVHAFLQQNDAFNRVRIIDYHTVAAVDGLADLSQANLGSLDDSANVFYAYGGSILRF